MRVRGENLRREGVAGERIRFVGNTMIDTLLRNLDRARALPLPDGVERGRFAVVTLHRPSNVDRIEDLAGIMSAVNAVAERMPVLFPVHPRTAPKLACVPLHPAIRLMEPVGYLAFLGMVAQSRMVLTDSGGIQEETTALGIPCLTMRNNTERPITCEIGTNRLVGTEPRAIRQAALAVLDNGSRPHRVPEKMGRAGGRTHRGHLAL